MSARIKNLIMLLVVALFLGIPGIMLSAEEADFTNEERQWLDSHDTITVGYIDNYLPFCAETEDGRPTGIMSVSLEQILTNLNLDKRLDVKYIAYDSYDEMLAAALAGEFDVTFPAMRDNEIKNLNGINESDVLISSYIGMIYKGEYSSDSINSIAVAKGNTIQKLYSQLHFPDCVLVEYEEGEDCLKAVTEGKCDGTLYNLTRAQYYLTKEKYVDLHYAQCTDNADYSFGFKSENEALRTIINKGIATLDEGFVQEHMNNYAQFTSNISLLDIIKDNLGVVIAILVFLIILLIGMTLLLFMDRRIAKSTRMDQLTGCRNRMALDWAYDDNRHNRMPIGVVMCDLNGLKKINDVEGHVAGDKHIAEAGRLLMECYGKDNVYRVGGDEFVVAILGIGRSDFNKKFNRIQTISKKNDISISMGKVYFDTFDKKFSEILKEADRKMYTAKKNYYMQRGIDRREGSQNYLPLDEMLRELSENFDSIFYVDFDRDEVYPYRVGSFIQSKVGELLSDVPTYMDAMEAYISNAVSENDRDNMRNICSKKYIEEQLKLKRAFSYDHRVMKEGRETYYRIKFSNMDGAGALHHCVIGFVNEHSEKQLMRDYLTTGGTLLIVEDEEINRDILREILESKYKLYEASNGLEALEILEKHHEEIALVLTDVQMPECTGLELLGRMQEDSNFRNIPVIVTTSLDENENKIKCLELGAADFVSKPYNERVMLNRIKFMIRFRGISSTLNLIETDELTGLYAKEVFFQYAQNILDSNPEKEYIIVVSDVVGFKAINEQYGKEMGDRVLKYLASTGPGNEAGYIIGGRIGSDIFACIKPEVELVPEEERRIVEEIQRNGPIPNMTLKYGFYYTRDDRTRTVQQMCDRAEMAMNSIKGTYGAISARYDDTMRQQLLRQKEITDKMEQALMEEQFKVYFQPKQDIKKNVMAGAEALVRWIHPEQGFMNPAEFIPIFEKNGFITKLDWYIWRKVCQEIAGWVELKKAFPISVNVSRIDFSDAELADKIIDMVDEYSIPHELFHIEVTESAYSDNMELMTNTIHKLREAGFIIELDDFGTGYSSITALNKLEIDIIKLDMSIIRNDDASDERNILNFIMQLAKMMKLKTIQEGVETEEQLDRVRRLGCDYVQGYYFSKPLPPEELKEYVLSGK